MNLKNYLYILLYLFVLSCKNSNETAYEQQFCKCIKVSKQLNEKALKHKGVSVSNIDEAEVKALKNLIHEKDSVCEPYTLLSATDLKQLRKKCIDK